MAFIFTLIWSVVLANVVGYVVGAMTAYSYDPSMASIAGIFFAFLIVLISAVIGGQEPSEAHH